MNAKNPNATAEALLRDVAFALRMARKISAEIRREHAERAEIKRPALTGEAATVTLGA